MILTRKRPVQELVPKPVELSGDKEELATNLRNQAYGVARYTPEELVYIAENHLLEDTSKYHIVRALFKELFKGTQPYVLSVAAKSVEEYGISQLPLQLHLFDESEAVKQDKDNLNGISGKVFNHTLAERPMLFARHPNKTLRVIGLVHVGDLELSFLVEDQVAAVARDARIVSTIRALGGLDMFKSQAEAAAGTWETNTRIISELSNLPFGFGGLAGAFGLGAEFIKGASPQVGFVSAGVVAVVGLGGKLVAVNRNRRALREAQRV